MDITLQAIEDAITPEKGYTIRFLYDEIIDATGVSIDSKVHTSFVEDGDLFGRLLMQLKGECDGN